uniref:Myosin binding protein C2 n=1 Tax=Loxodonta africana TaxID=9785 RepID=G3U3Y5_LOXAF
MPEAKPEDKKAPKGKDAPKQAPKETLPKGAPAEPPKEAPAEDQSPLSEEPTGVFLKKPNSVSVEAGKDTLIVAKLNGKELSGTPIIKWFKGKWLELGIKSGTRFSFKEHHDSASNVYTVELHIGKVVLGDRGDYRLEVKSKDTCDSCGFSIDVEAPRQDASGQSLESFKRTGDAKSDAGELDFSSLLKKSREVAEEQEKKKKKSDDDDLGIPPEVWELLKGAKKSEYERIAFQYGITDLRGMLKRLKKVKVEVKKSSAFTKKLDPAYHVDQGNKIKLVLEISDPDLPLKWFKNGQEIKPSGKYMFENVGKKRILTINKCTLADDAAYEAVINDEKCFTELFVRVPPVLIIKPLEDQQVFVGDRVEMMVEVSQEGAEVTCFTDSLILYRQSSSLNMLFLGASKKSQVIYSQINSGEGISFPILFTWSHSFPPLSAKQLEVLQDVADLTVKAAERAEFTCEVSDEKVTGKWYRNRVEVRPSKRITISHTGSYSCVSIDIARYRSIGEYFNPACFKDRLASVFNGLDPKKPQRPSSEPCTLCGDKKLLMNFEQVFSATEGRTRIEQWVDCSSFVFESTERSDEGRYTVKVTSPTGECSTSIFVRIVGEMSQTPPEAVRVTSVGEDWAILVWDPPKYDGGQPVTGYLLERKKKGSQRWMKLNFEVFTDTTYESTNMIEGIFYEMRVFAVNAIRASQPSMNTKPFMPVAPTSEPQHLMVEDVTDTTATLKWRPPERIGGGGIDGYLVEYCLEGSNEWIPANTEPTECVFTVKNLPTGAKIDFRVVELNIAGRSQPATLTQSPSGRLPTEQPKIRLHRHHRQTYIRKVGEQLNSVVPPQGKPRPRRCDKGGAHFKRAQCSRHTCALGESLQIKSVSHTKSYAHLAAILLMRQNIPPLHPVLPMSIQPAPVPLFSARHQTGVRQTFFLLVKLKLLFGFKRTSGDIFGEWFTVYEHNRHTSCTVSDLIVGNEYYFRVYSENICGLSDLPGVSKNTARILKKGLTLKPFEYQEHDFRTAPKFLTPLIDRVVIAGYSAALNCAVRGHPKPKVVWMKNKMEIGEDPKFLMTNHQGVLTLNIRRPSPFDAGTYSCRAVNELGEALAECRLDVRGED